MLKLNTGISRKVGEPDYGSRGASVNLELEVESNLINDPDGLMERVRRLFTMAREAVDQELNERQPPQAGNGRSRPSNGNGNGNGRERPATASQLRAIRTIADRLQLDPERVARDGCGVGLSELSLKQASGLIDGLKARDGAGSRR